MANPYEMFAPKKKAKISSEPVTLDYGEFKIMVKYGGTESRVFLNAMKASLRKYARRNQLAERGQLSDEAVEALEEAKRKDMAEVYAEHVIVGWEGVTDAKKKPLPYSRENVVKLLLDLDPLFADIIDQAGEAANFAKEEAKDAEKN